MFRFLPFIFLLIFSCSHKAKKLPFLGNPEEINGEITYPTIQPFHFLDQDSLSVTNKTFDNSIYIADFIFLSCPTICPAMTSEMKKVYAKFEKNNSVKFLSHTIDPEHDSISLLKQYAEHLRIKTSKWHIVTGSKSDIYSVAEKSYYSTAYPDSKEPGGFVHSGGLLLIDKNKHLRGVYDGTNPKQTLLLINDIELLLSEK